MIRELAMYNENERQRCKSMQRDSVHKYAEYHQGYNIFRGWALSFYDRFRTSQMRVERSHTMQKHIVSLSYVNTTCAPYRQFIDGHIQTILLEHQ